MQSDGSKTLAQKLAQASRERHPGVVDPLAPIEDEEAFSPMDLHDEAEEVPVEAPTAQRAEESPTEAIVRQAKARRAGGEAAAGRSKTCLIVDDSRVVRKISKKIVTDMGYRVIEAEDGQEGLARCKQSMPDLVLTDWEMPVMTGIEFVSALRAVPSAKKPVVVFCTQKGEVADIHQGIDAGADDYIIKPFDEKALRAKLTKLSAN